MIAILLFAALLGILLAVLLARYAPPILHGRLRGRSVDERPLMPLVSLRAVTIQLLRAVGLTVDDELDADDRRIVAVKRDPLGEIRYIVRLVPAPAGGVVDQATVLALAEDVKSERATAGVLITPGAIESAGLAALDVSLELLDGPRFRRLIADKMPLCLAELDGYRGFGPAIELRAPVVARTALDA